MPNFLGIDVGSTNWKAALVDESGKLLSVQRRPAVSEQDHLGTHYDPETIWQTIVELIREIVNENPSHSIDGIAVASMGEAGVPLDREGNPTYPAIAWFDTRARKQMAQLVGRVGEREFSRLSGLDPNAMFSIAKIAWLRETAPAAFNRTTKWLSIADYVNFRLTGELSCDYSLACRTAAVDIRQRSWSPDILAAAGVQAELFPELRPAAGLLGRLRAEVAAETGVNANAVVFQGGHDQACAFLASGALAGESYFDSSGTAESVMTLLPVGSEPPDLFRGLRVGLFLDPSRYSTMSGIPASGVSVDWAINLVLRNDTEGAVGEGLYERLISEAQQAQPGAGGALFLPHLRGAGAPHWKNSSRGAFLGLRSSHSKGELLRAVLEGLSFELRLLLELVSDEFGINSDHIVAVGGGSQNGLWQQIKAHVTQKTVTAVEEPEATARGAALLAAVGFGVFDNLHEASNSGRKAAKAYRPDPSVSRSYDSHFAVYRQLYDLLLPINQRIEKEFGEV